MTVAREEIDSHLVYRLLGPVCNMYRNMGIYQRNLENYDESPILTNDSFGGCVNCHSFANNRPDLFSLQIRPGRERRAVEAGMFVVRDGHAVRLKTQVESRAEAAELHRLASERFGHRLLDDQDRDRFSAGPGPRSAMSIDHESHLAVVNLADAGPSPRRPASPIPPGWKPFPVGRPTARCSTFAVPRRCGARISRPPSRTS